MANALTNLGQEIALFNDQNGANTNNGGIVKSAARLKMYKNTSTPNKNGTGFNEVDNGNGYTTAGVAITPSDWTMSVVGGNAQVQLADKTWTAVGGQIANIAGAYITDADGRVLAWWERATVMTLNDGDSTTADDLILRIV
jgi:hypothetical protein